MLRLAALAMLALLLAGCATRGAAVAEGARFTLAPGEQVSLPDASTLRYAGLANDSRCPPDVMCIRAGDADALFQHSADGSGAPVTLNTERQRSARIGRWRLQLLELAPRGTPPVATLRIDAHGTVAP